MAKKLYEEQNIYDIACAIREKSGSDDTYKTCDMADAIRNIEISIPGIPDNALVLKSDCSYLDYAGRWDWFFQNYQNYIIDNKDIHGTVSMFEGSKLEEINLNMTFNRLSVFHNVDSMFESANKLKNYNGKITNLRPFGTGRMFYDCQQLRHLPEFENFSYPFDSNYYYEFENADFGRTFYRCYSLRSIPSEFLKGAYNHYLNDNNYIKSMVYRGFEDCFCLDEINGIDIRVGGTLVTYNMFINSFNNCHRVKDIIFNTDNGTPFAVKLRGQLIDLMNYVGYVDGSNKKRITQYNSGITTSSEIYDDTSYHAQKNNPDSWTALIEYSRYNRRSAANTLQSLPDVREGQDNYIRFRSLSGSRTDEGAIRDLSAEELAVAIDKGWTILYA